MIVMRIVDDYIELTPSAKREIEAYYFDIGLFPCFFCMCVKTVNDFHPCRNWYSSGDIKCLICEAGHNYKIPEVSAKYMMEKTREETRRMVKSGEIAKPIECSICYSELRVEAHHADYGNPANVTWVCKCCHEGLHHGKLTLYPAVVTNG